jgi:hypothetical protein
LRNAPRRRNKCHRDLRRAQASSDAAQNGKKHMGKSLIKRPKGERKSYAKNLKPRRILSGNTDIVRRPVERHRAGS